MFHRQVTSAPRRVTHDVKSTVMHSHGNSGHDRVDRPRLHRAATGDFERSAAEYPKCADHSEQIAQRYIEPQPERTFELFMGSLASLEERKNTLLQNYGNEKGAGHANQSAPAVEKPSGAPICENGAGFYVLDDAVAREMEILKSDYRENMVDFLTFLSISTASSVMKPDDKARYIARYLSAAGHSAGHDQVESVSLDAHPNDHCHVQRKLAEQALALLGNRSDMSMHAQTELSVALLGGMGSWLDLTHEHVSTMLQHIVLIAGHNDLSGDERSMLKNAFDQARTQDRFYPEHSAHIAALQQAFLTPRYALQTTPPVKPFPKLLPKPPRPDTQIPQTDDTGDALGGQS